MPFSERSRSRLRKHDVLVFRCLGKDDAVPIQRLLCKNSRPADCLDHELARIGQEVSERLDVIMPKVTVIRTVRPKYACHHCEGSGDEDRPAVRIAPAPPTLIGKGIATPGLLAFIATAKFCDALPPT